MADPVASFALQDFIDLLGEEVFIAIFDDTGSQSLEKVKASTQVKLIMENAHAYVMSWMVSLGGLPVDNTGPLANLSKLVRLCELQIAQCYAYQRRPEYVRTYGAFPGGPMWKGITEMLERIQAGVQRIDAAQAAKAGTQFPQPNEFSPSVQDGPKALVLTDPTDNSTQGDW